MSNLRAIRLGPGRLVDPWTANLVNEGQLKGILDFFIDTGLREITFNNFIQNLAWIDMIQNSGPELEQLTIHTSPSTWRNLQGYNNPPPQSSSDSYYATILQTDLRPGFTHTEFLRLSSACPNLENLGFDVHGIGIPEAVSLGINPTIVRHSLLTVPSSTKAP